MASVYPYVISIQSNYRKSRDPREGEKRSASSEGAGLTGRRCARHRVQKEREREGERGRGLKTRVPRRTGLIRGGDNEAGGDVRTFESADPSTGDGRWKSGSVVFCAVWSQILTGFPTWMARISPVKRDGGGGRGEWQGGDVSPLVWETRLGSLRRGSHISVGTQCFPQTR